MGSNMFGKSVVTAIACAATIVAVGARGAIDAPTPDTPASAPHAPRTRQHAKPRLDTSGQTRVGQASVYSGKFRGRAMADGGRMNPQSDSAASKTLPLGSTAKVTNLATGQSAVVTIRDRGPYVKGRIVDLSPATAAQVGIDRHQGVSKVAVAPISLPPHGSASSPR
jgi:rare lipoprotein A